MGHGDLAVSMVAKKGFPIHLISKHFSNKIANDFWFGIRKRFGVKFIDPHGSKTPFDILKALKQKETVVFVLDQYMGPPYGVETKFFGEDTGTAYGLALFALKAEAPVITIFGERLPRGRYRLHFGQEIPFEVIKLAGSEEVDRDPTVAHMTQKYNHILENLILQKPRDWMWIHRRWKPFYSPPL
jgi:KDO2-lipid IV(A) lauroyltransferase